MNFLVLDLVDNERLGLPPEARMRVATHLTVAFHLATNDVPITTAEMVKATGLNSRTINIGFKHFVDRRYMIPTLVKASHGRGRAYSYAFTDSFAARIIRSHNTSA